MDEISSGPLFGVDCPCCLALYLLLFISALENAVHGVQAVVNNWEREYIALDA